MTEGRAITCPNCGGSIAIKTAGYAVSVGCQHCGALLDVTHPDVAVIERYEGVIRTLPVPLGQRGTLDGVEWEAVGALARSDGDVDWTETLLFNPYAGYRWLILSEGDWSLGTMISDLPEGDGASVEWRGQSYEQDYYLANIVTTHVVGEFYWRVRAGDAVQATTYSRGPVQLSAEWNANEVNWTRLVPVGGSEVERAFGRGGGGGPRATFGHSGAAQGFAALQHTVGSAGDDGLIARLGASYDEAQGMASADLPKMFMMAMATLLLSLFTMIGFGISTANMTNSGDVVFDGPEKTVEVGRLNINRPHQAVTIVAQAGTFENRWIDINYTLVDRQTQRGYTAYGVVEHYAGSDSDGPWTEGSFVTVTKFSGIPRGTYDVVADLQGHTWGGSSYSTASSAPQTGNAEWMDHEHVSVTLSASAGGILWGNLWLELALLLGLPLVVLWWRNQ